jgi:hypothetical protein
VGVASLERSDRKPTNAIQIGQHGAVLDEELELGLLMDRRSDVRRLFHPWVIARAEFTPARLGGPA